MSDIKPTWRRAQIFETLALAGKIANLLLPSVVLEPEIVDRVAVAEGDADIYLEGG